MEMKIKSELVAQYRKERAWSQQHLSEACSVSLRTIQRVENSGNSSFETIKALAACFEIDLNTLIYKEKVEPKKASGFNFKKAIGFSSLVLSICGSVLLTSATTAASNIEVISKSIASSHDRKTNIYSDNVSIFIPQDIEFTIVSIKNKTALEPQYQFEIHLDSGVVLVSEAKILMREDGVKVLTEKAKWITDSKPENT